MGIFIGIIPAWGFQTFLCISLAIAFRLNKAIAFLGSNISIPPFIPIIVFVALQIGSFIIPSEKEILFDLKDFEINQVKIHLFQYILGSLLLAIFASVCIGFIFYGILKYYERKANKNV